MGAKQTKYDSSYLPNKSDIQNSQSVDVNINAEDLRSPIRCRKPLRLQNNSVETNEQLVPIEVCKRDTIADNPLDILRKRFLRGFAYNLNDPRSPSLQLNRTPLVFEDTFEKSLNLNDTFADLLVESCLPDSDSVNDTKLPETISDGKFEGDIEMPEENKIIMNKQEQPTPQTPVSLQQEFDPRSPSIGVERTPIIFSDDEADNANEDVMLESILATLSLNLNASTSSSMVSMSSENVKMNINDTNLQVGPKPTNKHLDRIRIGKKGSSHGTHRKPRRRTSCQKIYEDQENHMPSTPKLRNVHIDKSDSLKGKRTPLSCVRNRNGIFTRSRSVESSPNSIKTRLALTSFDDTINPSENNNFQQTSQDSLEF